MDRASISVSAREWAEPLGTKEKRVSGYKLGLRKGFTLIELLVVVAIIALLISILLPSLSQAREQGKKAKCLAHLKGVGQASYSYASDDSAEQPIPIHMNMMRSVDYWLARTANWFTYGGNNATKPFPTGSKRYYLGDDPNVLPAGSNPGELRPEYGANRRPLNVYMGWTTDGKDTRGLAQFQCPGDKGYPDDKSGAMDDAPIKSIEIPAYDIYGNSFRASLANFQSGGMGSPSGGHFAMSAWGHRLSSITETSRVILYGEPTFFNMLGQDSSPDPYAPTIPYIGWHGEKLKDNILFLDGSARMTKVPDPPKAGQKSPYRFSAEDLVKMGVWGNVGLDRGPTYKLDVYPTPGARIWGNWSQYTSGAGSANLWPWRGFQDNLRGQ